MGGLGRVSGEGVFDCEKREGPATGGEGPLDSHLLP
jgi:hypothetical protein